jgi:hypothetical protein
MDKAIRVISIDFYFEEKVSVWDITADFYKGPQCYYYELCDVNGMIESGDLQDTSEFLNKCISIYKFFKQKKEEAWSEISTHKDNVESSISIQTKDKALKRWIERSVIC